MSNAKVLTEGCKSRHGYGSKYGMPWQFNNNSNMNMKRQEAIQRCEHWWYCDNVVNYPNTIALLHMDFPRVFILIRDYSEAYFATYEEFRNGIAEINFFAPEDREEANIEEILIDAWNFLSLSEEEDERLCNEYEEEEEHYDI